MCTAVTESQRHSFSVVIPVWNEELFLPRLLLPLRRCLPSSEIIVADHDSEDKSRDIARHFDCAIVSGGRPGKSRNAGAAAASGEIILFLDADVVIDLPLIIKMLDHFSDGRIICVHPKLKPISDDSYISACYAVANQYIRITSKLKLHQGLGSVIAVRKSAFQFIGGFSETMTVGEDADFFSRLRQIGRIVYDENICVFVSARRFLVENKFRFAAKCLVWTLLRLIGSVRCPWGYRWVSYSRQIAEREAVYLSRVERLQQDKDERQGTQPAAVP
jgi:glycosyltransferase involved in cell wall biosynthesis